MFKKALILARKYDSQLFYLWVASWNYIQTHQWCWKSVLLITSSTFNSVDCLCDQRYWVILKLAPRFVDKKLILSLLMKCHIMNQKKFPQPPKLLVLLPQQHQYKSFTLICWDCSFTSRYSIIWVSLSSRQNKTCGGQEIITTLVI